MTKLTDQETQDRLKNLSNWQYDGQQISKQFAFTDFKEAMQFVNKVADLAESANHHPDITINYNKVTLFLSTHSEGGVTQKDINLASQIEKK